MPQSDPSTNTDRAFHSGGHRRLFPWLPASLLMLSWVIPDIWATPLRFPVHLLSTVEGIAILSLVAWPVAGACIVMAVFLPLSARARWWVVALMGLIAVVGTTGTAHPGLPVGRLPGVGGAVLSVSAAAFLLPRASQSVIRYLVLGLLPGALLAISVYGVATGEHSGVYLWSFKAPLCLYLSMILTAESLRRLTFCS